MSINVQITFNERQLTTFVSGFNKLDTDLENGLMHAMESSLEDVQTEAKRRSPIQRGDLRRSITHVKPFRRGNSIVGQVGTNKEYARIQEFGGVIRARNHPYLVFKVNGSWVSVKSVRIKPKWYLRDAVRSTTPKIDQKFKKILAMRGLRK